MRRVSWWRWLYGKPGPALSRRQPRRQPGPRLTVEGLEQREVPATLIVTTLQDGPGEFKPGQDTTLRGAIAEANAGDTIQFSITGTITLDPSLGPLIIPKSENLTINAANDDGSSRISVSGNNKVQDFWVQAGANATLVGLKIIQGKADSGGGVLNDGTLTIRSCTLSGNTAKRNGGAIANDGTLTIRSSTLSGNSAGRNGGAIANLALLDSTTGTLTMRNSTLAGNTAGGNGGGLSNFGTARIENSTIANNSAFYYGGIDLHGSSRTFLANTIIARNNPFDIGGTGTVDSTSHHNLIGFATGLSITNGMAGNQIGTTGTGIDPLLSPLGPHGGPTDTMLPMTGSPAINGGDPKTDGLPKFDQRGTGFPRVINGRLDIGAVETGT